VSEDGDDELQALLQNFSTGAESGDYEQPHPASQSTRGRSRGGGAGGAAASEPHSDYHLQYAAGGTYDTAGNASPNSAAAAAAAAAYGTYGGAAARGGRLAAVTAAAAAAAGYDGYEGAAAEGCWGEEQQQQHPGLAMEDYHAAAAAAAAAAGMAVGASGALVYEDPNAGVMYGSGDGSGSLAHVAYSTVPLVAEEGAQHSLTHSRHLQQQLAALGSGGQQQAVGRKAGAPGSPHRSSR
jgi:hypothetical protein